MTNDSGNSTSHQDPTSSDSDLPVFPTSPSSPELENESLDEIPRKFQNQPTNEFDTQLVNETKHQIRAFVQEIAELAKSNCSVEDFYEGFLTRTTSALASIGGAIWMKESEDQPLTLQYHVNLKKTNLQKDKAAQSAHTRLLHKLIEQGEPTLVGPDSGNNDEQPTGNPTEYLLVVGPLKIDNVTVGLVEIFQRPGAGPRTQRGYLRFLMQMCDIASDFLRNQRIRSFGEQQQLWQQLEQFIRLIHQGLDTDQTAFTLANEGRRLIDCDRVSVALGEGRNCRIKAVSGLDSVERRADQVKTLGQLSAAVIKAGQPLWYTGDEELPPQIEKRIHGYVDKSHTRMLAILPLFESLPESEDELRESQKQPRVLGALIVEQLKDARVTTTLKNRANIVVQHGQTALTNATEHNSILLMPLWKTLGKLTSAVDRKNRGKTVLGLGLLTGILAFLALFPYEFGLGAKGSLIPEKQFEIFAGVDGTVQDLYVSNKGDTLVTQGQTLALLKNSDIDLAVSELNGRIAQAREEITSNSIIQNSAGSERLSALERVEIAGRIAQAQQREASLTEELNIQLLERDRLVVASPSDGRVVNWNLRQNLMNRPVVRGQNLMTVVPPNTQWLIELEMPERRLKHLIEASRASTEPLTVSFGLVSNPGTEYTGQLISIDQKLGVYSDEGNCALVRVSFANEDIDPELLRSETRVTAKVLCGSRSIGYVIFHELFETIESTLMFWF